METREVKIKKILDQAIVGIKYIIARMHKAIVSTRSVVNEGAPKMMSMQIDKDSIRTLIGPGGKTIKEISALSKAKIDIDDDGKINISAASNADIELAIQKINSIVLPFKIGNIYDVSVTKIADFGVFVKLGGNAEGFIHVSDLSDGYVEKIDTHIKVGQEVQAKMIGFDRNGKVKLTLKSQVEEVKIEKNCIIRIYNLQIVNGGQTTASIYAASEKYKVDLSDVNVPMKLSVVKKLDIHSSFVSNVAEFANTQNKVNKSDFFSVMRSSWVVESWSVYAFLSLLVFHLALDCLLMLKRLWTYTGFNKLAKTWN
jgi:predicted RNA-binding protein with RPS1 domain